MNINPLSSNIISLLSNEQLSVNASDKTAEPEASFADILTGAFGAVAQTDTVDKASALQLLAGQSDDLSGLLLDAQKAELSLNLALQIRNKVIDAYTEIMRMQV